MATLWQDYSGKPLEIAQDESACCFPHADADRLAGALTTFVSELPFATLAESKPLTAGGGCCRRTAQRTRQQLKREWRTLQRGLMRFRRLMFVGTDPSNNSSASAVSITAANKIVHQKPAFSTDMERARERNSRSI